MKPISKKEIETLIKLQEAETEIVRLQTLLLKVDKKKEELELKLKTFEKALNKQREEVERYSQFVQNSEQQLQIIYERIAKSNEVLKSVKTNREYQVLLREIDDNKKRKDSVETELLDLMDEKEKLNDLLEQTQKEFELLKEYTKAEQINFDKQAAMDRAMLEDYSVKQQNIAESLDPYLLNLFKKISKMNKGSAIVRVEDSVCMGCFMNVPPQMYIDIQKATTLILCNYCSRILYYPDPDKEH